MLDKQRRRVIIFFFIIGNKQRVQSFFYADNRYHGGSCNNITQRSLVILFQKHQGRETRLDAKFNGDSHRAGGYTGPPSGNAATTNLSGAKIYGVLATAAERRGKSRRQQVVAKKVRGAFRNRK